MITIPDNPFETSSNERQEGIPFGRHEVIDAIFACLTEESMQKAKCFSLSGSKCIGKTTVLRSIVQKRVCHRYLDRNKRYDLIYFDCEELPASKLGTFRLLGRKAIEMARTEWGIELKETDVSRSVSVLEAGGADAESTMPPTTQGSSIWDRIQGRSESLEIRVAFQEVLRYLALHHACCFVFVLDNFETLLSSLTRADIELLQDIFVNARQGLVVATMQPIREIAFKTPHPEFHEIFKKYRLRAFSQDQAYDYLTEATQGSIQRFSHSEKETILRKAGPHPHFLAVYAAETWRQKLRIPDSQPLESFSSVDRKAANRLYETFVSIWLALDQELQTIVSQFATEQVDEKDILGTLRRLEYEHSVVYLCLDGHFALMGELFKNFVISQTEATDHLTKTDFYWTSLQALAQLDSDECLDSDPEHFYRKAFQQFVSPTPDYDLVNALIRDAFACILDIMVRRSESRLGQVFTGTGFQDKMSFIERAFDIGESTCKLLSAFWSMMSLETSHPKKHIDLYDTRLRFYILSGFIQFLLNTEPKQDFVLLGEERLGELYQIEGEVSRTGHSLVIRAKDRNLGRSVAIKSLRLDHEVIDHYSEQQLLREARILAQLKHPSIGQIYHILPNPLRVVIEWVEGSALQDILTSGIWIPAGEVIKIGINLADALSHVHQRGIIHRDIKPSNIILTSNGEPVLIDFDIAHAQGQETISLLKDGSQGYIGTKRYSSPEQLEVNEVGPPADVFALGVVLYELLTHQLPYVWGNAPSLYGGNFPKPERLNIEDSLYQIMCSSLHECPDQRPTAVELRDKLASCRYCS